MAGLPGDQNNQTGTFGSNDPNENQHGYDANRYNYGGSPGAADALNARYADARKAMDMRQSQQLNQGQMNQSRGDQANALALARQRATNTDPNTSISGQQMRAGLNRVMAANQSAAASARGPAALALAQQQAAANTSDAMQRTAADAGTAAAQEAQANAAQYAGIAGAMRGQDYQTAATNAQLEEAQRNRNDSRAMGYENLGQHVNDAQQQANLAQQGNQLGGYQLEQQLEARRAAANSANSLGWFDRGVKMTSNLVTGAATSDVRSKEGTTMLDGNAPSLSDMPGVFPGMDATGNAATGAYKGYAAARAGQTGGMFGDDQGTGAASGNAPGTSDFMRVMGGTPALDGTGKMPAAAEGPQNATPGGGFGAMQGFLGGLGGQTMPMSSDERGKLAAAMRPNHDMEQHLAATAPAAYRYKDPTMPGTQPGVNVGPASAQEMQRNPVGSTMVVEDPNTGMLGIDKDKALKTTMSATSYVNNKVNNLARAMGRGAQ